MAQNVNTPRFYVNILQYLKVVGLVDTDDSVYDLNPSKKYNSSTRTINVPDNIFNTKAYVAFLGHKGGELNINEDYTANVSVNANIGTLLNELHPQHKGFSIASFNGQSVTEHISYTQNAIGSIVLGNYYDMPHSPDLSLKLSYEYDGVKTIQTKGGATLSNATYTNPADWWNGGAWQLGEEPNYRSGRRVWDLSFSYLSDTDLMPIVAASTNNESDNIGGTPTENTLIEGTDFFSQVWNRTLAGHLPFIFQADNTKNSPDQFAICRFDMNTLQYDQVANNVYNVKLKIRECW